MEDGIRAPWRKDTVGDLRIASAQCIQRIAIVFDIPPCEVILSADYGMGVAQLSLTAVLYIPRPKVNEMACSYDPWCRQKHFR